MCRKSLVTLKLADSESIIADAKRPQTEIQEGIENYASHHKQQGREDSGLEVDGLEMLVSWMTLTYRLIVAPYLGYCDVTTKCTATRRTILSPEIHTSTKESTRGLEVLIPSTAISGRLPFYPRIDNDG